MRVHRIMHIINDQKHLPCNLQSVDRVECYYRSHKPSVQRIAIPKFVYLSLLCEFYLLCVFMFLASLSC